MELFELTAALVNIPSVTGEEGACAKFMRDYLAERKFEVELQPVSSGRANVFAHRGQPDVVLSTHLDTVPPFIPAREDDEYIHGRGSCDAKGIAAAQVKAAEKLVSDGVDNIGLLFLVGEETSSDGAVVANQSSPGATYMINGEPTENKLARGTKGSLWLDLRARGRMAHSAYPHLGESAIEKLLDALTDLRRLPVPEEPVFGRATMNIGLISGGRAANVVPDEAQARVLFRTVPQPAGTPDLRREIERVIAGRCDCDFVRETPPLRTELLDGFETEVFAFTTDLPSLTRWGRPLLLGPGSISVAHTENERVRKSELAQAVELYCRLVRSLKEKGE